MDQSHFVGRLTFAQEESNSGHDADLTSPHLGISTKPAPDAKLTISSEPQVDFDLFRTWNERCQQHDDCIPDDTSDLERLKVIDCETRTVQLAPEKCPFVALSYLWGPQEDFAPQPLPAAQTRTIEDAITVTLRLGLRYLWVDRYCIEQTSIMDKTLQIKQMGQIYASAHLTIIAAAGTDPTHGLPGVSQPRQVNETVAEQVGPVTLVQLNTPTASDFQQSMWATRAWTFQEGILSKRRLIFTPQAVLYICSTDYLHDLSPGYSSGINFELVALAEFISCARLPREFQSSAGSSRFKEAMRYVTAYSRRNMRMSSDALNAIIGILNYISTDKTEPVYHLWGVPLAPLPSGDRHFDSAITETENGRFQSATKEHLFEFALNWIHPKSSRRRPGFPSWSPLGWEGPIEYPMRYMDIVINKEFDVRLHSLKNVDARPYLRQELKRGGEIKYEGKDAISTKLEVVSARVAPVQIAVEENGTIRITLRDGTALDEGFETYWDGDLVEKVNMQASGCAKGRAEPWLVWQIGCKITKKRRYHYVVLKLSIDGIYERVGLIIAWKGRSDAGLLDASWTDPIPCERTEGLLIA
ncbi:tol protein [Paraphaeosphaeria sporulosa]